MPTQISGAEFLAARRRAFLWDSPRVGKTGAAIIAADMVLAIKILVVTTASGRGVWARAFPAWSKLRRRIAVIGVDDETTGPVDVAIVSWDGLSRLPTHGPRPDLIILDEDHKACNPETRRAFHAFGRPVENGARMVDRKSVVRPGDRVWHLSGTPIPHDLGNAWSRLRASAPDRLGPDAARGWPDVLTYTSFRERYTIAGQKRLGNGEFIPVVFGGRNAAELRGRMEGLYLRRTQEDIGVQPPRFDFLPLFATKRERESLRDDLDLPVLRRLTGTVKAPLVAAAVVDEFDGGLDKIVLAYWHRDVGDILAERLHRFGTLRLDGSTPPAERADLERRWRAKNKRVFLAQIVAAGEAIDLSPSSELWFVEASLSPKDMGQMASRIVNVEARRTAHVKVCVLAGTVDEKIQERLAALWAPIREVMGAAK